jgi:hypothetical protein
VAARIIIATALRAKTTALAVVKLIRNVGFTFYAVFSRQVLLTSIMHAPWLETQFVDRTFEDDVECDVNEIRSVLEDAEGGAIACDNMLMEDGGRIPDLYVRPTVH